MMMVSGTTGMGQSMPQMQGMRRPSAEEMAEHAMNGMDADGDGSISAAESQFDEDMFAEIDADGDGLATSEELEAHAQAHIDEMEARMEAGDFDGVRAMMGDMPPPPPEGMEATDMSSSLVQMAMQAYADGASTEYSMDSSLLEQLNIAV